MNSRSHHWCLQVQNTTAFSQLQELVIKAVGRINKQHFPSHSQNITVIFKSSSSLFLFLFVCFVLFRPVNEYTRDLECTTEIFEITEFR
jgi:hypothetical protein